MTKRLLFMAVLVIAVLLRVYALELKPLHHDEGVNGWFLLNLVHHGVYRYNPYNYHGPTLYYFALPFVKLLGLHVAALRLVVVVFGVLTIALVACLRRDLGASACLFAALLLAVSPGAIFFSRYFIHEAILVCLTLALVVAARRYRQTAKPLYLICAAAAAGLMFATKETAVVTVAVLFLASLLATAFTKYRCLTVRNGLAEDLFNLLPSTIRSANLRSDILRWSVALAVFLLIEIVFYSSFFTYWPGVGDAFKALPIWIGTSSSTQEHIWYQYIQWMWQEDPALLIIGTAGALAALWQGRNWMAVFTTFWFLGILSVYSLVAYKTPWIVLNMLVPLAILSGFVLSKLLERVRALTLIFTAAAVALSLWHAVDLNLYNYDNNDGRYPYVYVQTYRSIFPMLAKIRSICAQTGEGDKTPIAVTSAEYWPLPWYLQKYSKVGFYGVPGTPRYIPLVIISADQEHLMAPLLKADYLKVGTYPLRPEVILELYEERDIAAARPTQPETKIISSTPN